MMELLSDSLPGGGMANKGIVDRDVACDAYGLPIIPARRVRGILREAAEELEYLGVLERHFSENFFGSSGASESSSFRIGDGKIKNATDFSDFLEWTRSKSSDISQFSPVKVLEHFTYVRAQTAVKDGVAKKNSLRISRVLKKGQVFIFPVACPLESVEALKKICGAVEMFGESRNRGLGEIRLSFEESNDSLSDSTLKINTPVELPSHAKCEMKVSVRAISQLLMSDEVGIGSESCNYIPGVTILGAMAARYLSFDENSSDSDEFERLFLSGETSWGNLYPAPKNSDNLFLPAPFSIRKYKDSDSNYVDLALGNAKPEPHKSLGNLFLTEASTKMKLGKEKQAVEYKTAQVEKNVEYHHRRAENKGYGKALEGETNWEIGDPGVFFQYETLEREQYFSGSIIGTAKDLQLISSLLPRNSRVYLGKSRVAQYGECKVTFKSIEPLIAEKTDFWCQGSSMIFRLSSDMVLLNENGHPAPQPALFLNEIADRLKIKHEQLRIASVFLKKKLLGGYLGVWNLPRVQYPALAGGTVIKIVNESGQDLPIGTLKNISLGLRVADGMGRFSWYCADDLPKQLKIVKEKPHVEVSLNKNSLGKVEPLVRMIIDEDFEKKLKVWANGNATKVSVLNNSALGRFIGMIKASGNFDELNNKLKQLCHDENSNAKPAVKALESIASVLYVNSSTHLVDENRFKQDSFSQYKIHEAINALNIINTRIVTFDKYRSYALTLLTAVKLRNRKYKNDQSSKGGAKK